MFSITLTVNLILYRNLFFIIIGKLFEFYRQLSAEDLAGVPANSTSNILNRLMVSYDPRIRPNFKGNEHVLCVFSNDGYEINQTLNHIGNLISISVLVISSCHDGMEARRGPKCKNQES